MNRNTRIIFIALLMIILLPPFKSEAAAINDEHVQSMAKEESIPAYSITLTEHGTVSTISNTSNPAIFESGSLSKPVTAYVCMKLVKEGKVSLEDPITKYLDEKWITDDIRFRNITIRHLLSHTAGFSPSFEFGVDKQIYSDPGSHFLYSGVGYIYLQNIIEKVYGGTLEQAAREYVFEPLHMENSTFDTMPTVVPYVKSVSFVTYLIPIWCIAFIVLFLLGFISGIITKYRFFKLKAVFYISIIAGTVIELLLIAKILPRLLLPAVLFWGIAFLLLFITRKGKRAFYTVFLAYIAINSIVGILLPISLPLGPELISKEPNAAYSLKSTSEDLGLFVNELLTIHNSENILDSENDVLKEMLFSQISINAVNQWGLGVAIEKCGDSVTYWHSGINPGMQSLFVIDAETKRSIVIMTNSDNGLDFAKELARDFLGIEGEWSIP